MMAYLYGEVSSGWNDMKILEMSMSFQHQGKTIILPVTWDLQAGMDLALRELGDPLFLWKLEGIRVNGMDATGLMWAFRTARIHKAKVKLIGQGKKDLIIRKVHLYERLPWQRSESMDLFPEPEGCKISYKTKRESFHWKDPVKVFTAEGLRR